MILFIDPDPPRNNRRSRRPCDPLAGVEALLGALGAYRDAVQVVAASPTGRLRTADELRRGMASTAAERVVGNLWDDPPPCPLGRYDHIVYWLTRRHVWRLPSWLSVQRVADTWPEDRASQLLVCPEPLESETTHKMILAALQRHYWIDLWWGEGPAPDPALRRRAHALMVAWSIPRRNWPRILGHSAREFEERLELLLVVHAGAQRHVRADKWKPHWVHLPWAALGMRRPIELITSEGLDGVHAVHRHVWQCEY